jgi:hypothetical protein
LFFSKQVKKQLKLNEVRKRLVAMTKPDLQFNSVFWDNTPLFVKYNPGLLDLLVLLDETGLQTGL